MDKSGFWDVLSVSIRPGPVSEAFDSLVDDR
jgi:hypothetical protein